MANGPESAFRNKVTKFVADRRIFAIHCEDWYEWDGQGVAIFPADPPDMDAAQRIYNQIDPNDIVLAQQINDGPDYTYGIGVVDQPIAPGLDSSEDAPNDIPVRWVTMASNGEGLNKAPVDDFPTEAVQSIEADLFVDLVYGLGQESMPPTPDDIISELEQCSRTPRLRALVNDVLPAGWDSSISKEEQLLAVARNFLHETDPSAELSNRRGEAQEIVAERKRVEKNTVQSKCGREIWDEKDEEDGYQVGYFNPALKEIEQRWLTETLDRPKEITHLALSGEDFHDLQHGDLGEDETTVFPDDIVDRGLFVALEDEQIISCGRFGKSESSIKDGLKIREYHSLDRPIADKIPGHTRDDLIEFDQPLEIDAETYDSLLGISRRRVSSTQTPSGEPQASGLDRNAIDALLEAEAAQAHIYREALSHLVAGKNLLFYGPPGTGKTRAARMLTDAVCANADLVTANAEWSNHHVVGGYEPTGDSWESTPGVLTASAQSCRESLAKMGDPSWLIIDELNRANLDEAFGEAFTLLDIDYRDSVPIDYGDDPVYVPLSFRIIGTMNTYDQAQLFSLGYAFRRRFAFVEVPPLFNDSETGSTSESTLDTLGESLSERSKQVTTIVEKSVPEFFETTAVELSADVAPVFSAFAEEERAKSILDDLLADDSFHREDMNCIEALALFGQIVTETDVIDIGQALIIDAVQFIVAHNLLFPEETGWETVDIAVRAYIVPQFEQFMSELRRAETVDIESDAPERYDYIINVARILDWPDTARQLERAKESKQILD
ncbi:McrB family protein [Saliphagus sp. GCM10025334]